MYIGAFQDARFQSRYKVCRTGITLLEVIVTFGIIGLLMAILVPAVQRSREASRLTQCRSNLRQLALAANNYESSHGEFPHGNVFDSYSVFVALLPQLDDATRYRQVNFDTTSGTKPDKVLHKRPNLLACPTDSVVWHDMIRLSYNGNSGWTGTWDDVFHGNSTGVFVGSPIDYPRIRITPSTIKDGLSHTAMFSEAISGGDSDWKRCVWTDGNVFQELPMDALSTRCQQATNINDPCILRCLMWTWGHDNVTLYQHVSPPNLRSCSFVPTAGSLHSGGVTVALADGGCKFFNDSVDVLVWRAIGTRAGSEVVSN